MTTSGVSTAEFDAATITEMACRRAGYEVEDISAALSMLCRDLLVSILNDWSNLSLVPWAADKRSITLTPTVESYVLPLDIEGLMTGATIQEPSGVTANISSISREDFAQIVNKDSHQRPSAYWFWRKTIPTIFFNPIPDEAYVFTYWCVRRLHDVTTAMQSLDVPMRWMSAIVDRLALEVFDMMPADRRMKYIRLRPDLEKKSLLSNRDIRINEVDQGSWHVFG